MKKIIFAKTKPVHALKDMAWWWDILRFVTNMYNVILPSYWILKFSIMITVYLICKQYQIKRHPLNFQWALY
jgi:hypothetical protein